MELQVDRQPSPVAIRGDVPPFARRSAVMDDFKRVYREAWTAHVSGMPQEAEAFFDVAKTAAGEAVKHGASGDDLATAMRNCCLELEEGLGVQIKGGFR